MVPGDTFLKKSGMVLDMCDRPLHAFPVGYTAKGKREYKIYPQTVNFISLDKNGNWHPDTDLDFKTPQRGYEFERVSDYHEIPCGKCLACRLEKAAEWANRCMLELKYHDVASFVTLTYDDEHIKYGYYADEDTGEVNTSRTLVKRDLQLFWKSLRKKYPDANIRYYACGEYGAGERPHYHAIIFSYRPDDLQPWKQNGQGDWIYISKELSDIWENGFVTVGDVTHQTCNYVARYVTKKVYGDLAEEEYIKQGRIPPFTTMSLKPAIGLLYFQEHPDCVNRPISLALPDKGITFNAPRYFKKKHEELFGLDLTSDEKHDIIRSQRDFKRLNNLGDLDAISDAKEKKREKIGKGFARNEV